MISKRALIGLGAAALLLGGCATGPYYGERYAYDDGRYYDRPADVYYERPARYYDYSPSYYSPYYSPYYYGPTIGLGFSFSHRGHGRRR